MKLPLISFFEKKEKPQYYLALLLRDEKVNAVIFEELLGKIRVVGEHEEEFTDTIEASSLDEWLEVLDKAISQAESTLPQNIETQKTIFGVKEDWVEGKQIKREYLARLKKVSDELGLTPIGFLVIAEAIAHFLGKEEGVPVSAILVEVGKKKIAVSLLRAGRVIETKRTRVEDSIAKTTDRILHHFRSYEVLPSRIILFNGKNEEDLSQELIGHSWSKSLPFLHVPQITTLPNGFDAKAILFGAASEMGFEVLGDTQEEKSQIETKETPEEPIEEKIFKESHTQDFGFVIEKDVSKDISLEVKTPKQPHHPIPPVKTRGSLLQEIKPLLVAGASLIPLDKISAIKDTIHIPHIVPDLRRRKIIFIPPLIILIFIGFILLYAMGLKATIVLHVKPNIVEKNQDMVFSTNSITDFAKNIIAVEPLVVTKDGSLTEAATGTKEIGEKAKGAVTIFNNSLQSYTFQKDSSIKSTNDLEFTFDESVTIASASGDASSPAPTQKKVSITAKEIGKEYNLPSGTKFTIATFPVTTVVAKNDSAFSGGSKKEVSAIAKEDIDKLASQLPKSLEKQAKEEMMKKISEDKEILPDFTDIVLSKKDFDKDVGDEGKSVKLKATVSYQTFLYKKSDIDSFAKHLIKQSANNMSFADEDINIEIKNIKQKKDKETTAIISVKATLIPTFDNQKLQKIISGKSFEDTTDILSKLPQVSSIDIVLHPNVSFLPKVLPRTAQNISFEVSLND